MTETDATKRPLEVPETFLPYLSKHRIYTIFKLMLQDLIIELPKDHLKHMKVFLNRYIHCSKDAERIIVLVSPELKIDVMKLVKDMIVDHGYFVITRRCIMDRYEKHEDYVPGCMSPVLLSEVTKAMTSRDPVPQAGWLMFDHPCTVREARCLQQDGVLPNVTLVLMPTPVPAPPTQPELTPKRSFFQQDFEGLKYTYKSTLKEVHIAPDDTHEKIAMKCFNAIHACITGAQGPMQGIHVHGAPGPYRVLLIGPRGSGRKTQGLLIAKQFGLVFLDFETILDEARKRNDAIGKKLRSFGASVQLKADIVKRRLLMKDCIDNGWVLIGYPLSGLEFEHLDNMPTPPNRVIFLNTDWNTCKARKRAEGGVDWCTGRRMPIASGPRVLVHPSNEESRLNNEWDYYFTEALAELRAAAGLTAVEIDSQKYSVDEVQVKIQAAIMAAPEFNIKYTSKLRNVCGD